jgi:hypothetical protein
MPVLRRGAHGPLRRASGGPEGARCVPGASPRVVCVPRSRCACLSDQFACDDDARHEFARLIHVAVLAYCISLLCFVCGVVCIYICYALESHVCSVQEDFMHALEHATRSVAPEELDRFEEWTREFGEEGV